jgi:hypothetical protein
LELVKLGITSLYNSANSYECYQNPQEPKCKMAGIGDIFRYFGSAEQRQQVQILERLAEIKQKLDDIKQATAEIKAKLDLAYFDQKWTELEPERILQTMSRFNNITEKCKGKTADEIQADSLCKEWLGTGPNDQPITDPSKFGKSRLGLEMRAIADIPPEKIYGTVEGHIPGGGSLNALADVVTTYAIKQHFFTATESRAIVSHFAYFLSAELAYITVFTNYWEAVPPPFDLAAKKSEFLTHLEGLLGGVQGQLARFTQLPPGTTVDTRTGVMWSTNNSCLANSLESPAVCGIRDIGGFGLAATCPPNQARPCQLNSPLPVRNQDEGDALLKVTRDASDESSWKVPTDDQVLKLIRDRGGESGGAFVKKNGQIDVNSEYVWTSVMWCPGYQPNPFTCADVQGSGIFKRYITEGVPLRVSIKLTNGDKIDNRSNACSGGPCRAAYIFVRQLPPDERQLYGLTKLG